MEHGDETAATSLAFSILAFGSVVASRGAIRLGVRVPAMRASRLNDRNEDVAPIVALGRQSPLSFRLAGRHAGALSVW